MLLSIRPVRLTIIFMNKLGDVKFARWFRDGNLLIVWKDEERREKTCRMKEIGRCKGVSVSKLQVGGEWSNGVIWGILEEVTMEEISSNMKGTQEGYKLQGKGR